MLKLIQYGKCQSGQIDDGVLMHDLIPVRVFRPKRESDRTGEQAV